MSRNSLTTNMELLARDGRRQATLGRSPSVFYFSALSDVSILTKPLRRLATLHAIISFFFNTAVPALMINLAASLI